MTTILMTILAGLTTVMLLTDVEKESFGFESAQCWTTAPVAELQALSPDKFSCQNAYVDPLVQKRTISDLAAGAVLTTPLTEGQHALRWSNHPAFPTLRCTKMPKDWSEVKALALDIHSEKASGELICIAFEANNPATPEKDYWYYPVSIDWQGTRTLILPRADFLSRGCPADWKDIQAIYFFTKMLAAQPHPDTVLILDNLRMLAALPPDIPITPPAATGPVTTDDDGFVYKVSEKEWQRDSLNHPGHELRDNVPVYAPYAYQNYYQTERAQFGYYPKFIPGYVSFDFEGKAMIFARDWIQFKGADGRWEVSDLRPVLTNWAKEQGWEGLVLAWNLNEGEKFIRFDRDGDAYTLTTLRRLNRLGRPHAPAESATLLLHSHDKCQTWAVHSLGPATASMERLDGHNRECLDRPPVILLSGQKTRGNVDPGSYSGIEAATYMLLPEKSKDGSLVLPEPIRIADFAIAVPVHSGDGNMVITSNGKIYAVYSWFRADLQNKALAAQAGFKSPVPAGHPGLKQTFKKRPDAPPESSANGTPIFIVTYDLATRSLSEPVYIMSGGSKMDNHNWPAITIDGDGILHILANGHQDPANYTHSLKPYDITAWSAPDYLLDPNDPFTRLSYATLNCDRAGNLYSVMRDTTGRYNNRLSLFSKPKGQGWLPPQDLVIPFSFGYKNWGHKMGYNPVADQLCLSFYSQSNLRQLYPDTWAFDLFTWPDREAVYHTGKITADGLSLNYGPPEKLPRGFSYSMSWAGEPVSLLRQCPTGPWKLAVSKDFK